MLCFGLVLTAHINTTTITITTNSYTILRLCAHRSVWDADYVSISVTYYTLPQNLILLIAVCGICILTMYLSV